MKASLTLLVTVLTVISAVNGVGLSDGDIILIDNFIESIQHCEHIPGLILSVVDTGQTLITKGYGVRSLETREPATEDTIFALASMTKAFTSSILADILSKRPELSWDTPVREILGADFSMIDDYRTQTMTLRDVMSFKSGIEDNSFFTVALAMNETREQLAMRRLKYFEEQYPFRTIFLYSNTMYILAGYIAETLTGKTWEELVQETLFAPLGMTSSGFAVDMSDDPRVADSYALNVTSGKAQKVDKNSFKQTFMAAPAGAVMSNAIDMTKWLNFQLTFGKNSSGSQIVDMLTLAQTHTGNFPLAGSSAQLTPPFPVTNILFTYAMGWMNGVSSDIYRDYHNGWLSGFNTAVSLEPTIGLGIFTAINGPHTINAMLRINLIHDYITDLYLDKTPWLTNDTACTYPSPWIPTTSNADHPESPLITDEGVDIAIATESTLSLVEYTGEYGNNAFGNVTIYLKEGDEKLYYSYGLLGQGVLTPTVNPHTFLAPVESEVWYLFQYSIYMVFASSKNSGVIDQVSWPVVSSLVPAPLFHRDLKYGEKVSVSSSSCLRYEVFTLFVVVLLIALVVILISDF
ncbi:uncharacterized protein LOC100375482 [Saccoglossus kowalevskii]|uniref:Beta-lactamase-like protein 2-like n=1 Tax=Saccoglossus kowalevskii TaxID=10224 RepID=A0ABM0GUC8_SACKO|nr:PREDICTED: beta-lactamase-like protein 2-like [Saccoglossus kowalevskii]